MTPYHSQYWANLLTLKGASGTIESLSRSISNARVDLNPHQVDAAHWSDDLKTGLEREIKDIDRQIREARKSASLAGTLAEKLEMQRAIKTLESTRTAKRRDLYEAQDQIDKHRDELIGRIETQLRQKHTVTPFFMIRWTIC